MTANSKQSVGCVIGTRPEVIKMAPVFLKLQASNWALPHLINTAQHRNILDEMLDVFNIKADFDLDIMIHDQSLAYLTSTLSTKLDALVKENHFDLLIAAGDTTTVFVTALIAFYNKIPFAHIEAGLRSYCADPFPEEMNRLLVAPLASWHFAPTVSEKQNLLREHIHPSKIFVTGNPVIDSLYWVIQNKPDSNNLANLENIIILTIHRRENIGENIRNICTAMLEITNKFPHVNIILPVHPNPNVQKDVMAILSNKPRIHLLQPLKYDEFVHLMRRSILILTDSGGIQEEAPALRKPVLVLRNVTERPRVITAGEGLLVGNQQQSIVEAVSRLLTDKKLYASMSRGVSPYGSGDSAVQIVNALEHLLNA